MRMILTCALEASFPQAPGGAQAGDEPRGAPPALVLIACAAFLVQSTRGGRGRDAGDAAEFALDLAGFACDGRLQSVSSAR
jgi:hypothetical protein